MDEIAEAHNVIIVDSNTERVQQLNQAFEISKYNVIAHMELDRSILERIRNTNPDIILIGIDSPSEGTLETIDAINLN